MLILFSLIPLKLIFNFKILGLIVYRVLRSIPKFTVKLIHAALQGISFIVAVVGIIAVFQNNDFENNPDMYSLHSWIGMSTAILFGLQVIHTDKCQGGYFAFAARNKKIRKK